LSTDYLKVVSWGKLLNAQKFKIGICWQGSKSKIDIGRSFPLSLFEGISKLPNVELISLCKGEGEKQIQEIEFNLTTLGSDFDAGQDAFLDTSAVIKNCDLVITSDTAVAHLAGSLGCETWLILKHVPDWRWMLNRTDSPWYPTMSLYRQKTPGNWADVFTAVEQKLFTKLEEGK
jgi:ADP-heptose:LPS heptosyltransferase